MPTNWSEEKSEAVPLAQRNGTEALAAVHGSPSPTPTRKIDAPVINGGQVKPVFTAGSVHGKRRFLVGGSPLHCPHCQHEDFSEGSALRSMLGISYADPKREAEKKVTVLMCDQCGLIQWFGVPPQER